MKQNTDANSVLFLDDLIKYFCFKSQVKVDLVYLSSLLTSSKSSELFVLSLALNIL